MNAADLVPESSVPLITPAAKESKPLQPILVPQFFHAADSSAAAAAPGAGAGADEPNHTELFHTFRLQYDEKIARFAQERRDAWQQRFEDEVEAAGGDPAKLVAEGDAEHSVVNPHMEKLEGGGGEEEEEGGEEELIEVTVHSATHKVGGSTRRFMLSFHAYEKGDGTIGSDHLFVVGYNHRDGVTYEFDATDDDWKHFGFGPLPTLTGARRRELCEEIAQRLELSDNGEYLFIGEPAVGGTK
jgi:hypothetical protein